MAWKTAPTHMKPRLKIASCGLALALLAAPGFGAPTIVHDPIATAQKGQPLGVKATVRDATGRVETVSLFYAASRGMTPFRASMASSGAGVWFATIPGHMLGPGDQLLYYIAAENSAGETKETEWQTVKLVDTGVPPEAIPSASTVARQAERQAQPAEAAAGKAHAPAAAKSSKSRYLVPAAVIVGGAVAVGGALAIVNHNNGGGGGDGGGGTVTNGNYGGNYEICFASTANTNVATDCDSGLVNIYVANGVAEIVGMWGAEVVSGSIQGQNFTATANLGATPRFPAARLIVTGEFSGSSCTARVDGYSTDPLVPGDFSGRLETTLR